MTSFIQNLRFTMAACLLAGAQPLASATDKSWHLDSFRAFSEGHFPDGGVNIYAAADGTVRLINAFDFNGDGLPDIFIPSMHAYGETVDLSIYWDQPGYVSDHVTRLPTEGGVDAAVADLNRDGWPDLVVVNGFNGARNELNAYIYWGGKQGFSTERRTLLPTQGAEAVVIADLNGNGWPDIVIANNGRTYHVAVDYIQESYIYWNDSGSFHADRKTVLPTINGRDVAVADLNGDKYPDIVLVSAGNEPDEAGARIFWGGREDYCADRSLFLPGEGSTAVTLGDLNRNGQPDLVLVNGQRLKGRDGGIYNIVDTVHLDSFIYWNSDQGFDPARRSSLPTIAGNGAAIGDLDQDGWPDVTFANSQGGASFVYWGSSDGFKPHRRLALPTHNARSVLAVDLQRDGHVDLIFANANQGNNYDIDSYIYWGGPQGPAADRRQGLATSGANAAVVADLKNAGRNDLIFINSKDGTHSAPSSLYLSDRNLPEIFAADRRIEVATSRHDGYSAADLNLNGQPDLIIPGQDGVSIYWAQNGGFSPTNRTAVNDKYAFSTRVADFNRDGYLDMLLSEWTPGSTTTHIYYGGPAGFSSAARTALPITGGIRFHTIADFNGDGWIDVAFPAYIEEKVVIFWNGPDGFVAGRQTELPVRSSVALEVADLNRDGHLDLLVPNMFDKNPAPEQKTRSFGGSPEGDLFIFWGSSDGFSTERRTVLPGIGFADVGVADLNNNGLLDLVITSYHGGSHRQFPSYIYWQTPEGFTAENVTRLPTNSASGVMTIDYNADGWTDILFANHHRDGSHRNESYLYWGSAQGFSPERRLDLPANGPHLLTVTDPGNVQDRRHDYHYVSPSKEFANAKRLRSLDWKAITPSGTSIRFQIRSAATADLLDQAEWEGPTGTASFFAASSSSVGYTLKGAWVQFRATLSNPGGGLPVLQSVTLGLE